jgi:hypothetical protein
MTSMPHSQRSGRAFSPDRFHKFAPTLGSHTDNFSHNGTNEADSHAT